MPLIPRIESDMFVFADVCSYMVNPVNLVGAPGKGLALEFRKRVPQFVEPYREACRTKELRMGTLQIFEDTGEPWGIINFPTKDHYYNQSEPSDIARGLEALRELLLQDRYRHSVVGMPMLGCGLGQADYDVVYPLMVDHLSDLEATIFLSMAPEKTQMQPRHLAIAGPLDYGNTAEDQQNIDRIIKSVMTSWQTDLSSYTGIISGGYPGVDAYVCGENFLRDEKETFVFRETGKTPLVAKPNQIKDGVAANLKLGNLLCEVAEDIILFKPKGHNNNRLSAMQIWLKANEEERHRSGMIPRRVAIWGDRGTDQTSENVLLPEESDIPY